MPRTGFPICLQAVLRNERTRKEKEVRNPARSGSGLRVFPLIAENRRPLWLIHPRLSPDTITTKFRPPTSDFPSRGSSRDYAPSSQRPLHHASRMAWFMPNPNVRGLSTWRALGDDPELLWEARRIQYRRSVTWRPARQKPAALADDLKTSCAWDEVHLARTGKAFGIMAQPFGQNAIVGPQVLQVVRP